jgi:hypothetical protein
MTNQCAALKYKTVSDSGARRRGGGAATMQPLQYKFKKQNL